jgi:hypothetical protein
MTRGHDVVRRFVRAIHTTCTAAAASDGGGADTAHHPFQLVGVHRGGVLPNYGWEGGGKTLVDAGAVMADDLSSQKARILLMLLLQNGVSDQKGLQAAFSK